MNNKIVGGIIFAAGATVGALAVWHFAKAKYEKIAEEEIESVKQTFKSKTDISEESLVTPDPSAIYGVKIAEYSGEKQPEEEKDYHYVITPNEFGDVYDYDTKTLLYFRDGVLSDDDYEVVDDVEEIIGEESLTHFGEYEEDAVYVRNDKTRCDYEILLNLDTYRTATKDLPPHRRRT